MNRDAAREFLTQQCAAMIEAFVRGADVGATQPQVLVEFIKFYEEQLAAHRPAEREPSGHKVLPGCYVDEGFAHIQPEEILDALSRQYVKHGTDGELRIVACEFRRMASREFSRRRVPVR